MDAHRCIYLVCAFVAASVHLTACGLVRDEPNADRAIWPDGRYSAQIEWFSLALDLSVGEEAITGEGTVTNSPIDGIWTSDEFEIDLEVDENAHVNGTWTALWGSGTVGGVVLYPALVLRLDDADSGEQQGRLDGTITPETLLFEGIVERGDTKTALDLQHLGELPTSDVAVTGTIEDDNVFLQIGPNYQFQGTLSRVGLDGIVEFNGVTRLRVLIQYERP